VKQQVEITWTFKGKFKKEVCYIRSYDDVVLDVNGEPVVDDFSDFLKLEGFVVFEDEHGCFLMQASQIVDIKQL
jgi:hypothetical protein